MLKLLAYVGRKKSTALVVSVIIAILLPALGQWLKPYVTQAVFGLLVVAFIRIDYCDLKACLKKPKLILLATIWTTLLIPLLIVLLCLATGIKALNPDLFLGLTLQAIASPMTATPAIAVMMGLDGTLIMITLISSTLVVPFSAALIVWLFGLDISLTATALGLKLFSILSMAALLGIFIRKALGGKIVKARTTEMDGINILFLFVFVCAVMGGLGLQLLTQPQLVLSMTILAFFIFFVLMLVTFFIFKGSGRQSAFALAILASQRNMGLMLAGTSGLVPELTWLYFAVSQFPLYLSPIILKSVMRRLKVDNQIS